MTLPVKIVLRFASAPQVQFSLITSRAMREGDMVVADGVEEVNFLFLQKEGCSDGMNRCVSPSFVEEATVSVEDLKVIYVCLGSKPVEITNFEV